MASGKLSAFFLIFLICSSTIATACNSCGCNPKPTPTPSPEVAHCPRDALKLAVCANVLGLVNVTVGDPVTKPCCTLIKGLADLEAAVCLCTAIKANILGNNLVIPVALSVLLSACQKTIPPGFQCT